MRFDVCRPYCVYTLQKLNQSEAHMQCKHAFRVVFSPTGRNYSDILSVLHAVEVGSVEGALLDMYVVASRPEFQKKDSLLMVKAVIENPSTYGIELAGHATKLRKPFLHYLHNNAL